MSDARPAPVGRGAPSVVAIGLVAGVMSGLLGVGGGVVMVPLLVGLASLSQHEAHATSLAAIVPIALAGAIPFALEGNVWPSAALFLALGALVGAPAGARVMAAAADAHLKGAFGILMIVVGTRMLWS